MKKALVLSCLLLGLCGCDISYGTYGRGNLINKYQNLGADYDLENHYYNFYVNYRFEDKIEKYDKVYKVDISKVYTTMTDYYRKTGISNELFEYEYDTFVVMYFVQ